MDFKAVSQTDLTRVEFRLWRTLASGQTAKFFYKHFDLISIVDKSTDSGKSFSICFYNNIEGFYVPFY